MAGLKGRIQYQLRTVADISHVELVQHVHISVGNKPVEYIRLAVAVVVFSQQYTLFVVDSRARRNTVIAKGFPRLLKNRFSLTGNIFPHILHPPNE